MHLQPVFSGFEALGGDVAEDLFAHGICLPSSSNLTPAEQGRVIDVVCSVAKRADAPSGRDKPGQPARGRPCVT
jgi:dTDP-4-amino-4,6-dideoxygalactose transaminase